MRMAPQHVKRTFWWELVFIGILLFLLAGARSQRKQELVTATRNIPVLAIDPSAITKPLMAPLVLK